MTVYIFAPYGSVSGGPELSHQLCYEINQIADPNVQAKICYADATVPVDQLEKAFPVDAPAPERYQVYQTDHAKSFEEMDRPENVVIFPEGITYNQRRFKNARRVLWWMSVDNYFASTGGETIPELRERIDLHLYQSEYAHQFLIKSFPDARTLTLSDYINEQHGTFLYPADLRKDIALYNPKKGYEALQPLIEKTSWLNWIPLTGLSLEEEIVIMQSAKIYVDFGEHPGKDRIPREAAANGDCVITNKRGSAAFKEDVPIPEKYKFEEPEKSLENIDVLMHEICSDFQAHQDAFVSYREIIHGERAKFTEDTKKFIEVLATL